MSKEDEIKLIAYRIWEEEGCQSGHDCEHWFRAEALWEKERKAPFVPIGSISEFFARPVVAGVNLTGPVKMGDVIKIKGHTTDLEFPISSLQIDHTPVREARPGDQIGIKVPDRVRTGDKVYKLFRES